MVRPEGEEMIRFGEGTGKRGVCDKKRDFKTVFPLKSPSPQSHTYFPSLFNDCLLIFSHKYLCSAFQKPLLVFGVIVDNISGLPSCNLMLVVRMCLYSFRVSVRWGSAGEGGARSLQGALLSLETIWATSEDIWASVCGL